MKRLLIGLGISLMLAMVTPDAMAQRGRGNSGGQARQAGGREIQTRARNRVQASQSQQGVPGPGVQLRNQVRQSTGVLASNEGSPDLLRMWEEEKLARDVYTNLATTYKLTIFRNISRAESQHMQSVERLIQSGGAIAGELNDVPGVFVFPEYQQLYRSLVASGTRSPLDALMVGAKIEEMDIADLRKMLRQTTDSHVRQTLERLMQASENHLRAFASQITRQGASYNAEFLTQAEFDQIANASGQGHGRQSGGNGSVRGQGSPPAGQRFGPQFQGKGGYRFGAQNQNAQGGGGLQGSGGVGQSRGRQGGR